jgi:hypothetical protein
MRGTVFSAPGDVRVETVPDPAIVEPSDAIVRVTKAGICGSDMHIYNHGDAFGFGPGCRLGHEFVGVVEEIGSEVRNVRVGQKVASPFWISCGACHFCRRGLHTSCLHGGAYGFQPFWPGGGEVQGGQSQFVRVPLADGTLEGVPEALADDAHDALVLPLTDVFATAYHAVGGGRPRRGRRGPGGGGRRRRAARVPRGLPAESTGDRARRPPRRSAGARPSAGGHPRRQHLLER